MISFSCHSIRSLYFVIILTQINISNKWVFCEPQRGRANYHRPSNVFLDDDHSSSSGYDSYKDSIPFYGPVANYMAELTQKEVESNKDILNALTKPPPISARDGGGCDKTCSSCLASCNHIKQAKGANSAPLVQYLYLAVCAKGCKKMITCISDKYCLPVMKENPDYFIQCGNYMPKR